MRIFTSEAAKSLISIIGTEYHMAQIRVERRYIKPDAMLGTLLERLNRLACKNTNLRKFLDNVGHIPVEEDENMDLEWAADPRNLPENDPAPFQLPSKSETAQVRESGNSLNSPLRKRKKLPSDAQIKAGFKI